MDRLPIELISHILDFCPLTHNEALSSRLVCKAFASCLNRKAFRRIRTDFSRDAFDRLVNLSQSPLAECVVEFEYKLIKFEELNSVHAVDPLIGLETQDSPILNDDDNEHPQSPEEVAQELVSHQRNCLAEIVSHHERYLTQIDIRGTFYDILCLSKALPFFRNLKSVVISRFDGTFSTVADESCTTRAFWAVIKALQRCDPPIESFTIDSIHQNTLYPLDVNQLEQLCEVLNNLKQLCIPLLNYVPHTFNRILHRTILEQAKQVEVLRLGFGTDSDNRILNYIFENSDGSKWWFANNLRVLELRCHNNTEGIVKEDTINALLKEHAETLEELTLVGLCVFSRAMLPWSWENVFRGLRGMLKLRKVELGHLTWQDSTGVYLEAAEEQLRQWEKWLTKDQSSAVANHVVLDDERTGIIDPNMLDELVGE